MHDSHALDVQGLQRVGRVVQDAIQKLISARQTTKLDPNADGEHHSIPDWDTYNAQRALVAAAGSLVELAGDPRSRLAEVSAQYFESRALHIVVDARIADILAEAVISGVHVNELARRVGIEERKLCK